MLDARRLQIGDYSYLGGLEFGEMGTRIQKDQETAQWPRNSIMRDSDKTQTES